MEIDFWIKKDLISIFGKKNQVMQEEIQTFQIDDFKYKIIIKNNLLSIFYKNNYLKIFF